MTAIPATAPRSTQRPTALVVAFAFLVALVAVAFGSIVDAHASTRPVTDAGNVVAASTVTGDHVVASSADVPAGQCRPRAPNYDQTAVGFCVAAEVEGAISPTLEVNGERFIYGDRVLARAEEAARFTTSCLAVGRW